MSYSPCTCWQFTTVIPGNICDKCRRFSSAILFFVGHDPLASTNSSIVHPDCQELIEWTGQTKYNRPPFICFECFKTQRDILSEPCTKKVISVKKLPTCRNAKNARQSED